MNYEDWGVTLARFITASEARVKSYKDIIQTAYKTGNRDVIPEIREYQKSEESWHKSLVKEKTEWNAGMWCMNIARGK